MDITIVHFFKTMFKANLISYRGFLVRYWRFTTNLIKNISVIVWESQVHSLPRFTTLYKNLLATLCIVIT